MKVFEKKQFNCGKNFDTFFTLWYNKAVLCLRFAIYSPSGKDKVNEKLKYRRKIKWN